MRRLWLVVLLAAAPAFAQTRGTGVPVVAPVAAPVSGMPAAQPRLHPILIGSIAEPGHPLLPRIELHAARLAEAALASPSPAQAAAAYLVPLAQEHPADRIAAGAIARALADPVAAAALARASPAAAAALERLRPHAGAAELAAAEGSALADAEVSALFDGSPASLELEGLRLKRGRLRLGDRKAERLGHGAFGFVDEHPALPGAVVKTVEVEPLNALFSGEAFIRRQLEAEEPTARRLAEAGAGPRYLGRGAVSGARVSVRERVRGDTLERLIRERRFGPEEERLVLELLDRLAAARLDPGDFHPRNIMLGTTALVPERRAWVVDGGDLREVPAGLPRAELRARLEGQGVTLAIRMDPYVGEVRFLRPFRQLLDDGLRRSSRRGWWGRLVDGLREALADPPIRMH